MSIMKIHGNKVVVEEQIYIDTETYAIFYSFESRTDKKIHSRSMSHPDILKRYKCRVCNKPITHRGLCRVCYTCKSNRWHHRYNYNPYLTKC